MCVILAYIIRESVAVIQPGYKYDGDYNEKNQRHGVGHAEFHNGDSYDGQYENGKRHGKGIYKLVCRLSELARLENSKSRSRDPFMTHFYLILHFVR